MRRLLLETATDVCSVGVAQGAELLAEVTAPEPYRHASHLTVFIGQALEAAGLGADDLERIVLSDGPGSYTSLRVGAATAKGLCLALPGLELTTVPTLTALARATKAPVGGLVLATLNSRRGEVYGQLFLARRAGAREPKTGVNNCRLTQADWLTELLHAAGYPAGQLLVISGPGADRVREHAPPGAARSAVTFAGPGRCTAAHLLPFPTPEYPLEARDIAAYEPYYRNPPFVTRPRKKLLE